VDYTKITEDLFIGTTPNVQDYNHLRDLGVQLVINMRIERRPWPDLHHTPMSFLWLPTFDSPFVPIPIRVLQRGAAAALETIKNGGKVYVHCAGGRHRGVAMGAAILIAQGMDAKSAMKFIKERRSFADPNIFYIRSRILRFARAWKTDQIKE